MPPGWSRRAARAVQGRRLRKAEARAPSLRHAGGQEGGSRRHPPRRSVTPGHASRWAVQVMVKTCVRPVIVNVFMALGLGD